MVQLGPLGRKEFQVFLAPPAPLGPQAVRVCPLLWKWAQFELERQALMRK